MTEEVKQPSTTRTPAIQISESAKDITPQHAEEKTPIQAGMKERGGGHFATLKVSINKPGAVNQWHELRPKGPLPSSRSHLAFCIYNDSYPFTSSSYSLCVIGGADSHEGQREDAFSISLNPQADSFTWVPVSLKGPFPRICAKITVQADFLIAPQLYMRAYSIFMEESVTSIP